MEFKLDLSDDGLPLATTPMTSHDVRTAVTNEDTQSALKEFSQWYYGIHGYLCIAVCVFGIISNILNIVVLTHRRMASSPTNFILTGNFRDVLPETETKSENRFQTSSNRSKQKTQHREIQRTTFSTRITS